MNYTLDPELVPLLAARAEQAAGVAAREPGDWRSIREAGSLGQAAMAALVPGPVG
ncbi:MULTISPECIES: hypothetical protein [Streptacidiphilus]|uniref:Acyl-CoA dehydrogenase n=1 Tax=Streptacidiphilus cavernicola TaxID=3342716 RepID=A0ABV6UX82_9ACTN|nr:hypothetical protein [Streptacidiphilus jeojiense]